MLLWNIYLMSTAIARRPMRVQFVPGFGLVVDHPIVQVYLSYRCPLCELEPDDPALFHSEFHFRYHFFRMHT